MSVKLAIIYYSMMGTNYKLARLAEEGAKEVNAEVRVLKVPELAPTEVIESVAPWKAHVDATAQVPTATLEDLDWADAIIFSMPTRFGGVPSQIKQFLDTAGTLWGQGKLANKVVSGMSSAQNSHAGQEATILSLYTSMYHWGAIVAAPGFTDASAFKSGGNPYGTSVTVDEDGKFLEDAAAVEDSVRHQAKRTVTIAKWVKEGK